MTGIQHSTQQIPLQNLSERGGGGGETMSQGVKGIQSLTEFGSLKQGK